MPRRRQYSVPLDDCRVIISIAVRQPLNAPSDGSSSTLWYSCSVSSSDRPNCCRAVTSAFVSLSRGPPLSGHPSGTDQGIQGSKHPPVLLRPFSRTEFVEGGASIPSTSAEFSKDARALEGHNKSYSGSGLPTAHSVCKVKDPQVWSDLPGI